MKHGLIGFAWLAAVLVLGLAGCGSEDAVEETAVQATDPGLAMCSLCSMVVAEQPVPRAQVVHRDGHRVFLCTVSELGPYLQAPSSHGKPAVIFVEVLAAGDDGNPVSLEPHPWVDAASAFYVVEGAERPVMGESVLAYRNREEAQAMALASGGNVIAWEEVEDFLRSKVAAQ